MLRNERRNRKAARTSNISRDRERTEDRVILAEGRRERAALVMTTLVRAEEGGRERIRVFASGIDEK